MAGSCESKAINDDNVSCSTHSITRVGVDRTDVHVYDVEHCKWTIITFIGSICVIMMSCIKIFTLFELLLKWNVFGCCSDNECNAYELHAHHEYQSKGVLRSSSMVLLVWPSIHINRIAQSTPRWSRNIFSKVWYHHIGKRTIFCRSDIIIYVQVLTYPGLFSLCFLLLLLNTQPIDRLRFIE
jgi:hypothetical protein